MATQTGSIDLTASNGAKLYADAGFTNAEQTYSTKTELTTTANGIRSEVSETYATKSSLDDYATVEHVASVTSQTSNEFRLQFEEYDSDLAALGQTVGGLPTHDDVNEAVSELVSNSDARLAWLSATTEDGKPVLTLGTSETSYKARFDNEALTFTNGDTELATFGGVDGAHMPSAAVDTVLKIGSWIWEQRSNGHLTLKYGG